MAEQVWIDELNKAENDALRQAGDVEGLLAKYVTESGALNWSNMPQGDFINIVGGDWLASLNVADRTTFIDTWTSAAGMVRLNNDTIRTALFLTLSAQQQTDVQTGGGATQDQFWQSVAGLTRPTDRKIRRALAETADAPQAENKSRRLKLRSVRSKVDASLHLTSTANLTTIDTLIGV